MEPEQSIWKYVLDVMPGEAKDFEVPKGAKVLKAGIDPISGKPAVWMLVVPDCVSLELATFVYYGTGHTLPTYRGTYLDTVINTTERLVWHIFDRCS